MTLQARVALVTGGSRGIGRAIVLRLAGDGADVAINYHSNRTAAESAQREVEALGRRARIYQCDIGAGYEAIRGMVDQAAAEFGRLDIVVNNAGVIGARTSVHDADLTDAHRVMDTHFWGAYHCTKAALPYLRKQGRGDVIFISSMQTNDRPANRAPYVAAKLAAEGLCAMVAQEEVGYGIRANIVSPGVIETEMGMRVLHNRGVQDAKEVAAIAPFGRVGQPEDVANAVAYLCSEDSTYITNAVLPVDGGGIDWLPARRGGNYT